MTTENEVTESRDAPSAGPNGTSRSVPSSPATSLTPSSPRHFRNKDRASSLKNLNSSLLSRERSASWGHYSAAPSPGSRGMHLNPAMASPYSPSKLTMSPIVTAGGNPIATAFPFVPNLSSEGISNNNSGPPNPSATEMAMEKAIQNERKRAKEKEKTEATMTADELRVILKQERLRMSKMAGDVASLRSTAVACQAEAEVNEESRINCLMRRLEGLQQEKGRIIVELEREEEMLTNNLQKKLDEVRREKVALQQQIDKEQTSLSKLSSLKSPSPKPESISEVDEEEEEEDDGVGEQGLENKVCE